MVGLQNFKLRLLYSKQIRDNQLRSCLLLFFLLSAPQLLFTQTPALKTNKKVVAFVKAGEDALLRLDGKEAEIQFQKALDKKPKYTPALRGLAIAYDLQDRYEDSALLLEQIIAKSPRFSRVIYYDCAVAHYRYGNYDKAIDYFNRFEELLALDFNEFGFNGKKELAVEYRYRGKVNENIYACKIAKDSIFSKNVNAVQNLGSPINTEQSEYFPFLTNDENLLFFTRQADPRSDENLFISYRDTSYWTSGKFIDSTFNTPFNEGMATLTRDERQLFFTACQRPDIGGTCDILKANINRDSIFSIAPLKGWLNSDGWESQACISCDGSTIYFASNRSEGLGSSDIYVSFLQTDRTWSPPKNIGPQINTPLDEESPFISDDGQTLFFSSTGHLGMGEQDLFYSRVDSLGNWGPAINLGPPINTAYRELGFFLSSDGKTGYFSSDRPEGAGRMDIYRFILSQELSARYMTYVEGFVLDSLTRAPVQTVIYPVDHLPVPTDENGRFFLCWPSEAQFNPSINQAGYQPYQTNFNIPKWDNRTLYPIEILLQPKVAPLILPPPKKKELLSQKQLLYFPFDQFTVADSTLEQLNLFLAIIPLESVQQIEILGYADYLGSQKYNLDLSQKRASSVAEYINSYKASIPIIINTVEGKGEEMSRRNRAYSRRVEVVITYLE